MQQPVIIAVPSGRSDAPTSAVTTPARPSPRRLPGRRVFFLLLGISLVACLAVVLLSANSVHYLDEADYLTMARRLYNGEGYISNKGLPTAFRPPGYPFMLAPFMGIEHGILLGKLFNVGFLAATLFLIRQLVARDTPAVAWLAGIGGVAYPVWLYTASTLYPQTACMTLLLGIVYLLTDRRTALPGFGLAGLMLGLLILIAPSFQLLAPVMAALIILKGHGTHVRRIVSVAILTIATTATVAPWLIRNHIVFDRFVPIASNGGRNLLLGNSEFAGPNTGVNVNLDRYIARIEGMDEIQADAAQKGYALQWIQTHPEDAAWLYVQKTLNYFNYQSELATSTHTATWKDMLLAATYYPMLILVAVRLAWWRQRPLSHTEQWLLALYLVNGLLAAAFFTRIRFRLPFDGLLMALTIISIGHIHAQMRERRSGSLKRD